MRSSLNQQVDCLSAVDYPSLMSCPSQSAWKSTWLKRELNRAPSKRKRQSSYLTITMCHTTSEKIGRHRSVNMAFSAPNKFKVLCKHINGSKREPRSSSIMHKNPFPEWNEGVVHLITLDCDRQYGVQTGRCTKWAWLVREQNCEWSPWHSSLWLWLYSRTYTD